MLGSLTVSDVLILIVTVIISLTIHEMVHGLVGFALGDDTAAEKGRISLNPLVHIDPFMTVVLPLISIVAFGTPILAAKPVPFNPDRVKWDEFGGALIAAAGPLANLALAFIGVALANVAVGNNVLSNILYAFTAVNVSLFVFNLIPIPPLDGSRVLYAFAPDALRDFMDRLEPYGMFIVFGLVIVGGFAFINNWINIVFQALPFNPFII